METNHPTLPSNETIAKHRTQQLVKWLTLTPTLLKAYNQILAEQENRGFIERVDAVDDTFGTHYIPHHSVEKDSPTTPIRIVFDCSCRQTSNHPSLNDCLMIGLPCCNDLCTILLRIRSHRFGISTDIEKAFLHIQLHPDDRDFTHFYWMKDSTDPSSQLSVYRFKVIPFGATSSPFVLNAVLQHHLNQYISAVSLDMLTNLYVDNVISGCDTEQEVVHYYKESRAKILKESREKILMQTLWKSKIAWDEPLNEELHAEWKIIANDLKAASELSVTRCYCHSSITQPSIHCFADASLRAYGAVLFIVQQG